MKSRLLVIIGIIGFTGLIIPHAYAELPCVPDNPLAETSEKNFCNWLEYLSGDTIGAIVLFHTVHDQVKLESKILKVDPGLEEFTFTAYDGAYIERLTITKVIPTNAVDSIKLYNGTAMNSVLITDNPSEILRYYTPVEEIQTNSIPITELNKLEGTFDFQYSTGETFPINYQVKNADLLELSTGKGTISFILKSTNGQLNINFPKAIPLQASEGLDYPVFVAVHDGSGFSPSLERTTKIIQSTTDCNFNLELKFDDIREKYIVIEIHHGILSAGPQLTYVDLPDYCLVDDKRNDTDVQRALNKITCSSDEHVKAINSKDKAVCIYNDSFVKLSQRGYQLKY